MILTTEADAAPYLDRGFVVVPGAAPRDGLAVLADPRSVCLVELRGGLCVGELGHRGRHSVVWFECDGCGRMRRGVPDRVGYLDGEPEFGFCFLCVRGLTREPS